MINHCRRQRTEVTQGPTGLGDQEVGDPRQARAWGSPFCGVDAVLPWPGRQSCLRKPPLTLETLAGGRLCTMFHFPKLTWPGTLVWTSICLRQNTTRGTLRDVCVCIHTVCVCVLSCSVSDSLRPPWTVTVQAPLSMESSRQECWSGLPLPTPGDLPDPGIELVFLASPALAGGFFFFFLNH